MNTRMPMHVAYTPYEASGRIFNEISIIENSLLDMLGRDEVSDAFAYKREPECLVRAISRLFELIDILSRNNALQVIETIENGLHLDENNDNWNHHISLLKTA